MKPHQRRLVAAAPTPALAAPTPKMPAPAASPGGKPARHLLLHRLFTCSEPILNPLLQRTTLARHPVTESAREVFSSSFSVFSALILLFVFIVAFLVLAVGDLPVIAYGA